MKNNFGKISNRINTSSVKWDVKEGELPMWVADMDYPAMPEIQEAVIKAANNSYGYTYPTVEFFKAYQCWWKNRHHIEIPLEDMVFATGVVAALDSMLRVMTNEGDGIMLLSPVYHTFYNVIRNNHRQVVTSALNNDNDYYSINYQDIEDKFAKGLVKALIFCNPHNPMGRIWEKEEIEKLSKLCEKYNVYFISDEIHCDIVDPGYEYCSALGVNKAAIACLSPGKAFNLAGIHSAVIVVKNKDLREKLQEAFYHDDIGEPNYFAIPTNIAAYKYGASYIDELNEYLYQNKQYVSSFIKDNLPNVRLVSGHATYLLWLDVASINIRSDAFCKELREKTGLILSPGLQFGEEGAYYLRMNIATSLDNVKDAMNRLKTFIDSKEKQYA